MYQAGFEKIFAIRIIVIKRGVTLKSTMKRVLPSLQARKKKFLSPKRKKALRNSTPIVIHNWRC